MSESWIRACAADDIDEEDVLGFDHEDEHLENGLVIDCVIECPLHQGRFDVRNGKALSAPVCVDLQTWPVKREGNDIYINIATD